MKDKIINSYSLRLRGFYQTLVKRIFYVQTSSNKFNILEDFDEQPTVGKFPLLVVNDPVNVKEFQRVIEAEINQNIKNMLAFLKEEVPVYYFEDIERVEHIYSRKIQPIFSNKLLPVISLIFQMVKMAEAERYFQVMNEKLLLQYKYTVFSPDKLDSKLEYLTELMVETCSRVFKAYDTRDFSLLNDALKMSWGKMEETLTTALKRISTVDFAKAKEVLRFSKRRFEELFLDASPVEVSLQNNLRSKFEKNLSSLRKSEFFKTSLINFDNDEFVNQLLLNVSLLGGKSGTLPNFTPEYVPFELAEHRMMIL